MLLGAATQQLNLPTKLDGISIGESKQQQKRVLTRHLPYLQNSYKIWQSLLYLVNAIFYSQKWGEALLLNTNLTFTNQIVYVR